MRDGKLLFVQIAAIWILPCLILIPAWLEDVEFKTGNGHEDGRICYASQNGRKLHVTKTQFPIIVVTDLMVLVTIILSCCVLLWSFRKEIAETMEYHKKDKAYINKHRMKQQQMKRLQWSTAMLVLVYFILRVPWMIFAGTSTNAESFDYGYHICSILYIMKFSAMVLFGFANQNFRRAYFDIIKLLFPCCFKP